MTADERTQLLELLKKYEHNTDHDPIIQGLRASAQPLYQGIFNAGHSEATARAQAKTMELESRIAALTTEKQGIQTKLDELNGKAPDAEKLKGQYEGQITAKDAEIAKLKQQVNDVRLAGHYPLLAVALAEAGVDAEYAELVMVPREDVKTRLRLDEKGQLLITQKGLDIPIVPGQGETALKALAKELAADVPAKWRNAKVRRGSGVRDGDSNGEGGGTNVFDKIREEHKQQAGGEAPPHPLAVAAARLGQRA